MYDGMIKHAVIKKEAIPPHLRKFRADDFVFNISRLLQSTIKWPMLENG